MTVPTRAPLRMRIAVKSLATSAITKIAPIARPGLQSGMMTCHRIWSPEAPLSFAASIRSRLIRAMTLKSGAIMKSVNIWM